MTKTRTEKMVRAIIQARMLSNRLRGKSLMGLNELPLLSWVIVNARSLDFVDEIMVATTTQTADDPIVAFAEKQEVSVFRGSAYDVLGRYAEACKDMDESDTIVRITADNPLMDYKKASDVYNEYVEQACDYAHIKNLSHIVPEFIKVYAIREANKLADTSFDKEHVTPFFRKNKELFKILELESNFNGLRPEHDKYLTIDTIEQLHSVEQMLKTIKASPGTNLIEQCYEFLDKNYTKELSESDLHISLNDIPIGVNYPTFIIAEIGQNHNGDIELAKQLIDMAVECGSSAVKFQKRDIPSELTTEAYNKPYDNQNSFGKTYGEHREFLELSEEEHRILKEYSSMRGITYFVTPCDIPSVDMMERLDVPFYKVASRDLTNIPLLERLKKTGKPVIISTGMADIEDIDNALNALGEDRVDIIIMQCTSQYPADLENINLRGMLTLKDKYKKLVGLSDHHSGIITSVAASVMGAVVIEKHITISRAMKGSDHAGSLEKSGLQKLINYIRASEIAMGDGVTEFNPVAQIAKSKLSRSLTSKININVGDTLTDEMLILKSPGTGLKWSEREMILNKKAKINIPADTTLRQSDFE